MITLKTPVSKLPQVGKRTILYLHKLNIKKVRDLLFYFPFRYDDFSDIKNIADLVLGELVSIKGEIVSIKNINTRSRKMVITEAWVRDDSGALKVVWFNQAYLINSLLVGTQLTLSGKVGFAQDEMQLTNPVYELLGKQGLHTGRLVPVYHETKGLTSKWLRTYIKTLIGLTSKIEEFLPSEILQRHSFLTMSEAVRQIHFPDNLEKSLQAKKRLAFNELFLIQLYLQKQKQAWQQNSATAVVFTKTRESDVQQFLKTLPFRLTDGQKIAVWKIIKDLEKEVPMNRLLEGDVGSGKTLVALVACLVVIKSGYQALIMAPTEILAKQHYLESVKRFSVDNLGIKIALFTGSESNLWQNDKEVKLRKGELLQLIASGGVDLVIGTHTLIQESVTFKKLVLSVVDEQHRFGIEQRSKLQKNIINADDGLLTTPHLLSMTATPIPRTLSLTIYGDLDISLLKEKPKGRKSIITKIITPGNRQEVYEFIRQQVCIGRQAFVICPLIEESDILEVKSVMKEFEFLSKEVYVDLKLEMLHGKLKNAEKELVMKKFISGEINILVSTSVVEVGVDVPNATVMMIEGADRFGLAQLHQFRGRVGRSDFQSYCFLFTDSTAVKTRHRLNALVSCDNGFELAEKDLLLRGPGELMGVRQSGLPDLAMASLVDVELITVAKSEAEIVYQRANWSSGEYGKLLKKLESMGKDIHLE